MKTVQILLILFYLNIPFFSVNSQDVFENTKVIYQLSGKEIDFYGGDHGRYGGGVALEYYQNNLYLATRTKLFCINLSDTSHIQIDLHGIYSDPYGRGIKDIAYYRDTLFVIDNFENLLLIHDDSLIIKKKLDISFLKRLYNDYATTSDLFETLSSVDVELFFEYSGHSYPYSDLIFKEHIKDELGRTQILTNSEIQNPLYGIPLTYSDLLTRITTEENDSTQITYYIYDTCKDTIFQRVHWIDNLEYELSLSIDGIFRNDFTEKYYGVVHLFDRNIKFKREHSKMGMIILDNNLTTIKIIYPITKPEGELHFSRKTIFTNDELGNIYYSSTIFGETSRRSKVLIYKIETN